MADEAGGAGEQQAPASPANQAQNASQQPATGQQEEYKGAGGKDALKVEMITAHPDEITQHVIRDLRHSATIIHAEGGYSHQGKTMLICIINKHQITEFTKIISQYPDTFACVSSVNETLGNFKKIK